MRGSGVSSVGVGFRVRDPCTAALLVGLVFAIGFTVASPAPVHTLAADTLELLGRAGLGVKALFEGVTAPTVLGPLVRLVLAIWVAVAGPRLGDAGGVVAAELARLAGARCTVLLVRAIQAVSVRVTHELERHAFAIPAAEFLRGARVGGCGKEHPRLNSFLQM